jgi:RimJ/RimL family protein N-acetyltransferase
MILAREDDQIVGWIYLTDVDRHARSAQIGYGVRPHARGLQRAWLSINTDNLASLRVARKVGFTLEGTLRHASLEEDGLHDVAVLALLDDEI